jgi:hypothetical protein
MGWASFGAIFSQTHLVKSLLCSYRKYVMFQGVQGVKKSMKKMRVDSG